MTCAFWSPIRWYCSARWPAARRTSSARSGWLEMLGIRRKSSSSVNPCSRESSRNSSGAITTSYWNTSPSPACGESRVRSLVDEAQQIESGRGLDRPVIDAAPARVVHLRDREGPVPVHRLHVRHVPDRRGPTDALHHDGAHHRYLALGIAELLGVVPPLPGVARPRDIPLVRHPPGAVPIRELAAGAGDRCVAVGDGVVRDRRAEAVPRDGANGCVAHPWIGTRASQALGP